LENAACPIVQVWSGERYKTIADRYLLTAIPKKNPLPQLHVLHRFADRNVSRIALRRRSLILPAHLPLT